MSFESAARASSRILTACTIFPKERYTSASETASTIESKISPLTSSSTSAKISLSVSSNRPLSASKSKPSTPSNNEPASVLTLGSNAIFSSPIASDSAFSASCGSLSCAFGRRSKTITISNNSPTAAQTYHCCSFSVTSPRSTKVGDFRFELFKTGFSCPAKLWLSMRLRSSWVSSKAMRARSSSFSNCVFLKSAACGSPSAETKSVVSSCLPYSTSAATSDSRSASSSSLSSAKSDSTSVSSASISSVTSTGFKSATVIST